VSYLLDSDVIIDDIRGSVAARQLVERLSAEGIAISGMSYGELWEGIAMDRANASVQEELEEILLPFTIHWLDRETMQRYGEIRAHLRTWGQLIPAPDILIASTALQHGLTLITRNHRHFSRIPDLRVITPSDFT
jgi:tRNA(fMet)-specific endonuclease VapC